MSDPKLLLLYSAPEESPELQRVSAACQSFDPAAKKLALSGVVIGAETVSEPAFEKKQGLLKNLIEAVRHSYRISSYGRKLSRYYGMYPFEGVVAFGPKACFTSILFKLRFNSPLVWHLGPESAPILSKVWFKTLASIFCDRLIYDAERLPTRFPVTDSKSSTAVVDALKNVLAA